MPVMKVVEKFVDLELFTQQGWELTDTREVDVLAPLPPEPVGGPPTYQGGPPTQTWVSKNERLRSIVFVLRRDDDSALAHLNGELVRERDLRQTAETARDETKKRADASDRRASDAEERIERLVARDSQSERALALSVAQVRRFEDQIAAIRKDIGDARMVEILNKAGLGQKKAE